MRAEGEIWLRALILSCGLLALGAAQAEKLYKWTDAAGNVHYTDHAPTPAEAKRQERKKFGDKPADVPVSYALQRATKNFPITLYNADCGEPCSKAAALLAKRGVPFTDKNARDTAAAEELKAINGGKVEVPFLKLGTQTLRGFEEEGWNQALDAAGYPSSSAVPPKVVSKAPAKKPDALKPETPKAAEPGKEESKSPAPIKEESKYPGPLKEDSPAVPENKAAPVPAPAPSPAQ